jgi:starch synthase
MGPPGARAGVHAPPAPARIALLVGAPGVPVQGPSGASAHVRGLAAALSARADTRLYAVQQADHRGSFGPPTPARCVGLPPWPGPLLRWRRYREVLAARRVARAALEDALHPTRPWRPALVVERHSLYSDAGLQLSDRLGLPWVLEVNAPAVIERGAYEELRDPAEARRWEQRVLRAAPLVVAPSQALCRWLREEVGCRAVRWLPNGTDLPPGDRARGRAALGVEDSVPLVGFVGSMRPWHGVERLPALAAAVGGRAVAAGAGALPPGVQAAGYLWGQALADFIAALDLAVAPTLPGTHEGFCALKLLDYRSQGVPIVASDVGDAALLVDGAGGVAPAADLGGLLDLAKRWIGATVPPARRGWAQVADDLLRLSAGEAAGPLFSPEAT